jgi:hypothetical protein
MYIGKEWWLKGQRSQEEAPGSLRTGVYYLNGPYLKGLLILKT